MEWHFEEGRPIYLQIVGEIILRIANNDYMPGEKLPSVRDLALEAGVNPNTMQRALSELEREGIVYAERTSGRFVTDDESVLQKFKTDLIKKIIKEFIEKLNKMGLDNEDIYEVVKKYAKEVE